MVHHLPKNDYEVHMRVLPPPGPAGSCSPLSGTAAVAIDPYHCHTSAGMTVIKTTGHEKSPLYRL
eukprot:358671-Chlamydomonas_euryale.AAC.4